MTDRGDVGGWSFESEEYTVKRHYLREEFRVTDLDGNTMLTTERKVAEGKATFPFLDSDETLVFRVDSGRTSDVAGEYVLVDGETDETILVLAKEFGVRRHRWTVERPGGEPLAELTARRGIAGALNGITQLFSPFPRSFSVTAANGNRVGSVSGRLHPRTIYDVAIDRPGAIPRPTLTAGTLAVAVLESV